MKVNYLENQAMSLEINGNHKEQYRKTKPGKKVIQLLNEIRLNVSISDIEACHFIGKSNNFSQIIV